MVDPRASQFLSQIRAACRAHDVARLDLLRAVDTSNGAPVSAFAEFVVSYPQGHDLGPWFADFFALQDELSAVIGRRVCLALASPTRDAWLARTRRERRVVSDLARDADSPLKAA